jgi:hypothetical protein
MAGFKGAARQARKMQEATQRDYEALVNNRMQELDISRNLAKHLVKLELEIENLKASR